MPKQGSLVPLGQVLDSLSGLQFYDYYTKAFESEAEKRRMLKGDRVKLRKLVKEDFFSYESLKQATGIDFTESDNGAREIELFRRRFMQLKQLILPEAPDDRGEHFRKVFSTGFNSCFRPQFCSIRILLVRVFR